MPTLEEVREKYPQYADVPDKELADKLYTKFYKDKLTRDEFDRRMAASTMGPSTPGFASDVLRGATAPIRGVAQLAGKLTGPDLAITAPSAPKGEGVVTDAKVAPDTSERLTPGSLAGSFASGLIPIGAAGAIGSVLPEAVGPMARTIGAGALGGAMQPVEGGDFWKTKNEQIATGAGLGFGFSVGGKALTGVSNTLARWLGKKNPENLTDQAIATILDRFNTSQKYGGMSASDALEMINKSRKPLVLADAPVKTIQSLAGRAARSGPEGRSIAQQALETRDEGAPNRLMADIARYVHSGPSMFQAVEALNTAQKASATPLYEMTDKLQNIWSPRLQQFFENGYVRRGMNVGYRHEAAEALAENRPFDPTMLGVDLDQEGNVKILRVPNMRVLDMAKRGMDAIVSEHRDPITGKLDSEGRVVAKLRASYVKELDALDETGYYKKARETWGGYEATKDAIKLGRSVFGNSPEENQSWFNDLSKGDKEYARLGMADILRERLMKTGLSSDESAQLLKTPWMAAQMKPFFKSTEDYNKFVTDVLDERTMAQTKNTILRGSQTAERQAEDLAHPILRGISAAKIIARTAEMRFFGAVGEMWRLRNDLKNRPDPELDKEIAKILFAPDIGKTPIGMRLLQPPPPRPQGPIKQTGGMTAPLAAGLSGFLPRQSNDIAAPQ